MNEKHKVPPQAGGGAGLAGGGTRAGYTTTRWGLLQPVGVYYNRLLQGIPSWGILQPLFLIRAIPTEISEAVTRYEHCVSPEAWLY